MGIESPRELPIGAGKRELTSAERVPAVEVANEVGWVNPHIQAPFDIKEGEPTKLGLFVTTHKESRDLTVEGVVGHGRSAILGHMIFEDNEGRKYRDVDIKGLGNLTYWGRAPFVEAVRVTSEGVVRGILDYPVALKDAMMAEEFLSNGIRTYRVVAITKLKEIVTNLTRKEPQEKISIEEAKKRKMLKSDSEPALAIRAFGTHERIADLFIIDPRYKVQARNSFEDARRMVSQELGISEKDFTAEEYLRWFAKTIGENIGRIHKLGFAHGYLTKHNITLDCRLVDLDSVERPKGYPKETELSEIIDAAKAQDYNFESQFLDQYEHKARSTYAKDMFTAMASLSQLRGHIPRKKDVPMNEMVELFRQSYIKALHEKGSDGERTANSTG